MKVKPLEDRVIVKAQDPEKVSKGGIILPDTAKEKPQQGEIVVTGPGKFSDSGNLIKLTVSTGDTVLYGKYSGTEILVEGNEYLIMRESDILAVM